jgi:hypothetical protein
MKTEIVTLLDLNVEIEGTPTTLKNVEFKGDFVGYSDEDSNYMVVENIKVVREGQRTDDEDSEIDAWFFDNLETVQQSLWDTYRIYLDEFC